MNIDFSDQTVIVTGGTRGIGKSISESFLNNGAKVIAVYAGNDAIAAEFQNDHSDQPLEVIKLDVSNYELVECFFRNLEKNNEKISILVNNAGIRKDNVVGMMPPQDWNAVIETNLTGTYNMSKFALMNMMSNRYGRIISITSPSGVFGFAGQANYSASKAGQVAFTKSLAREAAKRSITVNCVSPGFIDTDLIADLPEDLRKDYKSRIPVKRFGKPLEVAHAVLFLASKEASYINGATLEVTGGL